jgi:hypothetical protein
MDVAVTSCLPLDRLWEVKAKYTKRRNQQRQVSRNPQAKYYNFTGSSYKPRSDYHIDEIVYRTLQMVTGMADIVIRGDDDQQ